MRMCKQCCYVSRVFRADYKYVQGQRIMFPFPGLYVVAWSALSFLMGVTVYYELQHSGDSLYHNRQALLGLFPMDTTHYDMPASDCNHTDPCTGFLYLMKCLPKIFYSTFLRKEKIPILLPKNSKHGTSTGLSMESHSRVSHSGMCMFEDEDSMKVCYWSKKQHFFNLILVATRYTFKACNITKYPLTVFRGSKINWEQLLIFGGIFSGTIAVAVGLHMFLHCCGLLCQKITNSRISGKSILVPADTLQMFKKHFEVVVQHKNINFKRAQQYYKTGLRLNLEKNTLYAENRALKREITCLRVKLMNQRFYIERLERITGNDTDLGNIQQIDCSTRIDDTHSKPDRICSNFSSLMDTDSTSLDEGQLTLVGKEMSAYTAFMDDNTALIEGSRFLEESGLNISEIMKLNHTQVKAIIEEEDPLQERDQVCSNIGEIIDMEKRLNQAFFPEGRLPTSFASCLSRCQSVQDPLFKLRKLVPSSVSYTKSKVTVPKSGKLVPSCRSYTKSKPATVSVGCTSRMQCRSFSADDVQREIASSRLISRSFKFRS